MQKQRLFLEICPVGVAARSRYFYRSSTVRGLEPKHLVNELLKRKINMVPSYRNFAVIDFDEKQVERAIGVSPHYFNTMDEINEFLYALKQII